MDTLLTFLILPSFIIVAVSGILLCLNAPKLSLFLLIIFTFIQDLFLHLPLPGLLQNIDLLDEFLLVGLTLNWVLKIALYKRPFIRTPIDIPFLLFIIFTFFSAIINSVHPLNVLFAFRDTFQYVLLFYAIIQLRVPTSFLNKLARLFWFFLYSNFIVLLLQMFVSFLKTGDIFLEDFASGIMGPNGAHKLGYFAGVMLLIGIGTKWSGIRNDYKHIVIPMLIIAFTSTRALYYLMPLLLILFVISQSLKPKHILYALLGIIFFVGAVYAFLLSPLTTPVAYKLEPIVQAQLAISEERPSAGRIGFFLYSWEQLKSHASPLIGVGPGWYVSKTASTLGSPLYSEFQQDFPFKNSFSRGSQLSLTVTEYGIIGTSLIFLLYIVVFIFLQKKTKRLKPHIAHGWTLSAIGALMAYLAGMGTNPIFEVQQISITVWFFITFGFTYKNINTDNQIKITASSLPSAS